jgi:ABC-2 type transport system permease protein
MKLPIPQSWPISPKVRSSFARIWAVIIKEFVQMRRDRLTLAMMVAMPLAQLIIFGYAINTDPKHLPTVIIAQDQGRFTRAVTTAMENSGYFDITRAIDDPALGEHLLKSGKAAFVVTIPPDFSRAMLRGNQPQILVEADASDPSASSNAIAQLQVIVASALRNDLKSIRGINTSSPVSGPQGAGPVEVVIHRAYNPEGRSQYSIVPAVMGVILTMTMLMLTSIAMTRETERGTLENLLAMPAQPIEVMIGKLTPYVGLLLFHVPFAGNPLLLALGLAMFIIANLSMGFLISTVARTQLQAMQITLFVFLPSILLSGFMFPFRGMPGWAQALGDIIPITHFLRVIRGVMLKGASTQDLAGELFALLLFTLAVATLAMLRYRRTLD